VNLSSALKKNAPEGGRKPIPLARSLTGEKFPQKAPTRRRASPRQPLLWAALAFSGGIAAGVYLWRPPAWWIAAAVLFGVFGICLNRRRVWLSFALVLAAMFAVGALDIQLRAGVDAAKPSQLPPDGAEVLVTAHATADGILQQDGRETRQTLEVETEEIGIDGRTTFVRSGLRIGIYGKQPETARTNNPAAVHIFRYGERLRFPTRLFAPRNFRNPGAFDYRGYLEDRGISALGSAKSEEVQMLPGFTGSHSELWRTRIHRSLAQRIQALWPADDAALVNAMLLGEESFLGRSLKKDFQRSGAYHVLVISGLKVGILALAVFWLLRRLRVKNEIASLTAICLIAGYAWVTDVGAPVWRATLMLAIYLAAKFFYRERSTLNAIGAAALALLIVNPKELLGASFQLSFLCVLIIAGIGIPLLERISQPYSRALRHLDSIRYDVALPPLMAQWRLDLRMIGGRISRFAGNRNVIKGLATGMRLLVITFEFLLISAIIQVGLVLPMVFYFHRAMIVGLPANILAVPLTELVMVAAILALALSYVWLPLARIPALVAAFALQIMSGGVRWMGSLQIADARVPTPTLAVLFAGTAALVLAMVLIGRRRLFAAAGLAVMAASAIWITIVPPHPRIRAGTLEVTAIDVGQGDSIFVVLPQGRTLLVDAGGMPRWTHSDLDVGEDVVSPYLWSRGISHLDAVVITHAHADHIGGMAAILGNFHPRELWLGVDTPSEELQRLLREAAALRIPVISHTAGDNFQLGGTTVRILAPEPDPVSHAWRRNDDSLVMKISYGSTSALLEGDAERASEGRIAEEEPQADLLKVAHHGSATSTIPQLLAAVHPRFALISVGARNVYGHPRQEVLGRLEESRVATYRTDMDGAVTFYLDGKSVIPDLPNLH